VSGYDQRKLSVYKGYVGERLADEFLRKQGYEIQSYMILVDFVVNHPYSKTPLHDWLGDKKR
jgi:hypothetical protein